MTSYRSVRASRLGATHVAHGVAFVQDWCVTDEQPADPGTAGNQGPEGLFLWIALLVVVFMGLVIAMAVIQTHAQ